MRKIHKHAVETSREVAFSGPVASPQNPAAHGNICIIEVCRCGATRRKNVNQDYLEVGAWDATLDR